MACARGAGAEPVAALELSRWSGVQDRLPPRRAPRTLSRRGEAALSEMVS